jgi:hypothetical protein
MITRVSLANSVFLTYGFPTLGCNPHISAKIFVAAVKNLEFKILGLTFSPVKGPEGNIEFLAHLTLDDREGITPDTEMIVSLAHETLKG